ncbi:polysaccharide biosynthesis tyrosine autokinase [Phragmitibacter flavus]|uniref:Polysaccharide biosynthesis tyrosine autokinase n=1 Tax=Phragmitibacter flavus TaxID=2576071 RepID=A0A5R8KJ37_9BACT|nr:polysaccharide biosynthesis tyrosine autokinase [Phragmitibacter flavus]TLD72302.1 polysaccharide biosynthesis tyrosine autokinase [Phragmitibacter flavus]
MDVFDNQPTGGNSLHRYHETSAKLTRYRVLLRRRWWFVLLTASIAVCVVTLWITSKETEYIAIGRIATGTRINLTEGRGGGVVENGVLPADFYGTQMEILMGSTLYTRAVERVRSLHPEIKPIEVDVKVAQQRGSSILNVGGTGKEPEFTRHLVEALLDEYMAFRKEMIDSSITSALNKVIQEVLTREKEVKLTKERLEEFLKNNNTVIFEGERNEAALYLSKLKSTLNDYQTERSLMEKMGLDDYLKQKDQSGTAGAATAPAPAPGGAAGQRSEGAGIQNSNSARSSDLMGGLSRTEAEYLNSMSDLKLFEAERQQLLRIYKPEHPRVLELDEKIEKQMALIEIHRVASSEEWQRRLETIRLKIANLNDEIIIWENKARDANDKIVTHLSLKSEAERVFEDYQDWKRKMDSLSDTNATTTDMVNIMERPKIAREDEQKLLVPLLLAFFGGSAAGMGILLLFDRLDDRMNSYSEFQALFPNEPVVGQIPELKSRGDVALISPNDDRHLYAEAFRNLRSSILFKNWEGGKPPKTILITSAVPNEGKTTTVCNMAITMALGGSRVLLADADLRRGGVNEMFNAPASPGFSEVLTGQINWRDAVQETDTRNLHILTRGEAISQTSELFLSSLSDQVLGELAEEYDYIIFDTAPVLVADDTASFAPKIDATLFVVRISSTTARLSAKALDLLYERQVNVAGVILNRSSTSLKEYTYYNYASYYSTTSPQKAKPKPVG